MIAVLYIPVVQIFEVIVIGHLHLSPLRSAITLDTWAYVVSLKNEVAEGNKIMKLSFFSNYGFT